MAWYDTYRTKALVDNDIKLAPGITVAQPIGEFSQVFTPVLVEQIATVGSTIYTDVYDGNNVPLNNIKLLFSRDLNPARVNADKPHADEPMSNFQMVWAANGWSTKVDNGPSIVVNELDHEKSYYIVWKLLPRQGPPTLKVEFTVEPTSAIIPFALNLRNTSIGAVRYEWKLDDRIVSTKRDDIITVNEPGVYDVTLTIWDSIGRMDKDTILNAVTAMEEVPDVVGTIEHQHSEYGRGTITAGEIYITKPTDSFGVTMIGLEIAAMEQAIAQAKSENRSYLTFYVKIDRLSETEIAYQDDTPELN